ncbi:MAG: ABC transporter ATP-binding protein [Spirochaetes bacterium]|nr:ABC transporter ATP-binding protein [Spirochaetota bacterium]
MSKIILQIKGLVKNFQSGSTILEVLQGLDLEVNEGDCIAIMGESGVGKSTLLSLIGGLDSVTEGSIRINDTQITQLDERDLAHFRARFLGFMFQYHYLLPEFNALENVFLPLLIKEKNFKKEFEKKARELLEEVGLKGRLFHKPGELSGGECQRVALSRALVKKPKLVIADEPTGNLDDKNTQIVFDLITSLNKKYNTTFIIATHNKKIVQYARKVYLLENGKLNKI